jgi:lysophosphatidylglycerol acyltransferase 1
MVLFPEGGFLRKRREASQRYAQKNNLPLLHNVTLPRIGALKTIIDQLGSTDDDLTQQQQQQLSTPPHTMKNINKVLNGDGDEFYIDNEYTNQQTPPDTPLRNAYNASNNHNSENNNNNNNSRQTQRIIDDDENLKEKIGEAEVSSKKTLKYVLDVTVAYPQAKPLDLGDIVTGLRRACQTHLLYRVYRCSEVPRDDESLTKWLYDRFVEKEELLENFYNTGSFAYPSEVQPTVVSQDLLRFFLIHLFFITSSYLHFQMLSMLYTAIFPLNGT